MSSFLRIPWFPAGFALLIGLSLRIFFAAATPIAGDSIPDRLSSYNDEIAHANYTHTLLTTHSLPVQIEPIDKPGALQRGRFENYQPPLYYMLHAAVVSLFTNGETNSIVHSGRVASLLLGLLLFPVFVLLARELKLSDIEIAAGIIFLSLSGVLMRFHATCTNDNLFWLFAGLIYWITLRLQRSESTTRCWTVFILLSTAALYTKLSALLLLPLPLVCIFKQRDFRSLLYWGASLIIVILLTLPVWFRNLNDFGALLPLHAGFGDPGWRLPDFDALLFIWRSLIFPWSEFWQGIIGLVLISIPLLVIAVRFLRSRTRWSGSCIILSFGFLLAFAAFLWLNLRYHQAESRYLFAAWPVLALVVSKSAGSTTYLWLLSSVLLLPFLLFLI